MTYSDALSVLEEAQGCLSHDGSLVSYEGVIRQLYFQVFRRTLRQCNCKDILTDALIELKVYFKHHQTIPAMAKYQLKNGALIFVKGQHYTNANLTDEVAKAYLNEFPQRASLFAVIPSEPEPEPAPEVVEEVAEEKPIKKSKKSKK